MKLASILKGIVDGLNFGLNTVGCIAPSLPLLTPVPAPDGVFTPCRIFMMPISHEQTGSEREWCQLSASGTTKTAGKEKRDTRLRLTT